MTITTKRAETHRFEIFIAGDFGTAKDICREFCDAVGLCVTVEPVTYVFTDGEAPGVRVGLINYPRFPTTEEQLRVTANCLASELLKLLGQQSYSIVGRDFTDWFSIREPD